MSAAVDRGRDGEIPSGEERTCHGGNGERSVERLPESTLVARIGNADLVAGDRHGVEGLTTPSDQAKREAELAGAVDNQLPGVPGRAEDGERLRGHGTTAAGLQQTCLKTLRSDPRVTKV